MLRLRVLEFLNSGVLTFRNSQVGVLKGRGVSNRGLTSRGVISGSLTTSGLTFRGLTSRSRT